MVAAEKDQRAFIPCRTGLASDPASVLAAVTDIVREVCDDPTLNLTHETRTDAIPAWRELTRAGIAVEAECRFDVFFHAQELMDLRTVGDLVALIATKRAALHA
jgi:acyl carrier protein